jgi:hypothetical protein
MAGSTAARHAADPLTCSSSAALDFQFRSPAEALFLG